MTKVTMLDDLRRRGRSFGAMPLHRKLDVLIEGDWLLIIFLLPVYFNPWCYNPFYFAKALALVLFVSLLLGMVLARWFLAPSNIKVGELPAKIRKSPLQFAALVLGLMWVVSTVFSVMPAKSLWGNLAACLGFFPNLAWIIFFLIVSQKIKDRSQVLRALYALLISSAVISIMGILQFINPDIFVGPLLNGRVYSTDGNPLSLSAFLAITMPITLALVILNWYGWGSQPRSKRKFTALIVLFGLQLSCLALAQYSITLLLYVIGIFLFFSLVGIFLQRKTTTALSILFVLLVVVIGVALVGQVMMTEKIEMSVEDQGDTAALAGQGVMSTLAIRVQNWKCAVDVMIDSPEIPFTRDDIHFLRKFIGYGPETFIATSQLKFPVDLKSYYAFQSVAISQPENHYLYLGVTMGILGLLAFLGLLAVFFLMIFRLLSGSKNRESIVMAAAFMAAIAQYCAHIFLNPSVIDPDLAFWTVLALSVALVRIDTADKAVAVTADYTPFVIPRASKPRKLMSVLIVIIFVAVGSSLTLPLLVANMKVRSGFEQWDKNPNLALISFTEATMIGPDQSHYHNILGARAFNMAMQTESDPGRKSTLLSLSELAGNAAIGFEPQMAIWRYRLADREMYRIRDVSDVKKANILYLYEEADQLFPGNAVILNKWALALMLMGDFGEAEQKLAEAGRADPLWSQNSYYGGLLTSLEGHREAAGEMFVLPAKGHARLMRSMYKGPNDIDYFIDFCSQAAYCGLIDRVVDDIRSYMDDKSDWIGWTFLGIADIYAGRAGDAMDAFNKSAELIPDQYIAELKGVITGVPWDKPVLQAAADDIIASLSARQLK